MGRRLGGVQGTLQRAPSPGAQGNTPRDKEPNEADRAERPQEHDDTYETKSALPLELRDLCLSFVFYRHEAEELFPDGFLRLPNNFIFITREPGVYVTGADIPEVNGCYHPRQHGVDAPPERWHASHSIAMWERVTRHKQWY